MIGEVRGQSRERDRAAKNGSNRDATKPIIGMVRARTPGTASAAALRTWSGCDFVWFVAMLTICSLVVDRHAIPDQRRHT